MTETNNSPTKPNGSDCPECSRLASRVELLEEALDEACWDIANDGEDSPIVAKHHIKEHFLNKAERKLAGAHAEEKE